MSTIRTWFVRSASAVWFRWLFLALALACLAAALWWIAAPLLYGDLDEASERTVPLSLLTGLSSDSHAIYLVHLALFFGALLLTQWMFLRPRRGWSVRLTETGRPMTSAMLASALMAMMLSLAGIATLLELFELWDDVVQGNRWLAIPVGAWILWLLWAGVFYAYWTKGTRFEQLKGMARGLIAGSVLELLVSTGVFVWKTDEENCYCARGSYVGLVFGATVMIWAFGPGLVFLFLREARYGRPRTRNG
jgi:hypothetical protein